MRRCDSIQFERMALLVGWRKGDAASIMASSAGGQSIALLSMCLLNVLDLKQVGEAVYELSKKLLSRDSVTSSAKQLANVAKLLHAKLETIDFGNVLAQQVVRVHQVYEHLGLSVPRHFLARTSWEDMVQILEGIARALKEENVVVRITGSYGLGLLLGFLLILFPEDVFVTVNAIVICEGPRKSIIVNIEWEDAIEDSEFRDIRLETILGDSKISRLYLPIDDPSGTIPGYTECSLTWKNWIADRLQLKFHVIGSTRLSSILVACGDLLISLTLALCSSEVHAKHICGNFSAFARTTLHERCYKVLGVSPSTAEVTLIQACLNLAATVSAVLEKRAVSCTCRPGLCTFKKGLDVYFTDTVNTSSGTCLRFVIWKWVLEAVDAGFWSFLVNASDTAVVPGQWKSGRRQGHPRERFDIWLFLEESIAAFHANGVDQSEQPVTSQKPFMGIFDPFLSEPILALSGESSTIYPSQLPKLELDTEMPSCFDLVNGKLIFENRYQDRLYATEVLWLKRHKSTQKLLEVRPTFIGVHSSLMITIQCTFERLVLGCTARVSGVDVPINLANAMSRSLFLKRTEPCPHSSSAPLDPTLQSLVTVASVATLGRTKTSDNIEIAQTLQNPQAQLLCCGRRSTEYPHIDEFLLADSCLNCAVRRIKTKDAVIIV